MIRPTRTQDCEPLIALARGTDMFKPLEIEALSEVLEDYFATNQSLGHRCVTYEMDAGPLGFAYYAPAAMTDRTWYLYWIAVRKDLQAQGIGGKLLRAAEEDIRNQQGRLLLVETSSLPHYQPTRQFYLKHAYLEAARIADFYAAGDDMVVFAKRFPQ